MLRITKGLSVQLLSLYLLENNDKAQHIDLIKLQANRFHFVSQRAEQSILHIP